MNKLFILFYFCTLGVSYAQDDLLAETSSLQPLPKKYVASTFQGTRLINFHTVEITGKRLLDFRVSHRFGTINTGVNNLWGLDGPATIKIGFDYSWDGRWAVGVARNSLQRMYEGSIKYKLLRQTEKAGMPVSLTTLAVCNIISGSHPLNNNRFSQFENRLSYVFQVIIARKFTDFLSLQIAPVMIHYNLIELPTIQNDHFAVLFAGRLKCTKSLSVTGEYGIRLTKYSDSSQKFYNTAAIGIDLETGGHVFQLNISNSAGMNEAQFVPYTTSTWENGGVRIGFNISRVFKI